MVGYRGLTEGGDVSSSMGVDRRVSPGHVWYNCVYGLSDGVSSGFLWLSLNINDNDHLFNMLVSQDSRKIHASMDRLLLTCLT